VDAGEGVEDIRQKLNGRTSILIGQSGVGKSSLLNTLLPEAVAKVSLQSMPESLFVSCMSLLTFLYVCFFACRSGRCQRWDLARTPPLTPKCTNSPQVRSNYP
jgi:GTPase SAR1 family protein